MLITEDIVAGNGNNVDTYAAKATGQAVLTLPYEGMDAHYALLKTMLERNPEDVLQEIKQSGIRGRGGAGFPMGLKLEFCRKAEGDTKFIICNADEGDPGAYSDRYLLEKQPHSVLFGMLISGYVTLAKYGILYIRAEYPEAVAIVQKAIDDLEERALIGDNINDSGFSFHFKITNTSAYM